ncbi:MAG: hypothetical protein HJJLKODD_00380 [Phycisphaerae bacterium]|nr:hypothetical protein [Phycisphaerae bacterium]
MFFGTLLLRCFMTVTVVLSASAHGGKTTEPLHIYGPEDTYYAMQESATAFEQQYAQPVKVTVGPMAEWQKLAATDADLVIANSEYILQQMMQNELLKLDMDSVTPLYLRPSMVLARPDNPKNLSAFPDLLKPGIRILVDYEAGQRGLWEEMAARQGDVQTIRAFRKNIACVAHNADEATQIWNERSDLDAWVTWNTWHVPLHDQAYHVPISQDYVVYRQCCVALTAQGRQNPAAVTFVEFLTSAEGAKIFESWEWTAAPAQPSTVAVKDVISIVCRINNDNGDGKTGQGLKSIKSLLDDYASLGIPAANIRIVAVVQGPASYWLLRDEPYAAYTKNAEANPHQEQILQLMQRGVNFEICAKSLNHFGWNETDILPGVKIVTCADPRIVDLELQGYAYLSF